MVEGLGRICIRRLEAMSGGLGTRIRWSANRCASEENMQDHRHVFALKPQRRTASADDLSGTFLAQNTRLSRLGAAIAALLPTQEREHTTVSGFALASSTVQPFRWKSGAVVRKLAPASGFFKNHLHSAALARFPEGAALLSRTVVIVGRLEGPVEGRGRRWRTGCLARG
jgi:hypothetical protein